MKDKSIFKDLIMVLSSNVLLLLSSIVTGLIIPKLLGVSGYGYFKTFTLYTTYTALLHFGFIDGILLKHGAESYSSLDRKIFRANSQFFIRFQVIIAVVILAVASFIHGGEYSFIFVALAIYMVFNNITTYYQFISQATLRFKELSVRKIVQSVMTILAVIVMYLATLFSGREHANYRFYVILTLAICAFLSIWYVYTYRDITFGSRYSFKQQRYQLAFYFKEGIYLTVAYQVSTLVFNMDSQYVSLFFSKAAYGIYAFAYSLIQMILTVLNAVSTVLFPHIKRKEKDSAILFYPDAISYVVIVVYFAMLSYFPIQWFVHLFLSEYTDSLMYFQVLFPGVGLTCCITLITFNYYKILDENKRYFYISLGILCWTGFFTFCIYMLFHTIYAIAWSSLITLAIWRMVTEQYLVKKYHIIWKKNIAYTVIMMLIFIVSAQIKIEWIAIGAYFVAYIIITFVMYRTLIKNTIFSLLNK